MIHKILKKSSTEEVRLILKVLFLKYFQKVKQGMSKICVFGQGYIGLPTAILFANSGHEVVGIDVNKRTIDTFKEVKMPFEEKVFRNYWTALLPENKELTSYQRKR